MYSRILVPVDGSLPAARAVEEAVRLSKALGSHIQLLHVVDTPTLFISETNAGRFQNLMDFLHGAAAEILKEAVDIASRAGVQVEVSMVDASDLGVGNVIVRRAQDLHCDLIVCGTHGRRGLPRLLMGSDAEYVLRHAAVPVLLVRDLPAEKVVTRRAGAQAC